MAQTGSTETVGECGYDGAAEPLAAAFCTIEEFVIVTLRGKSLRYRVPPDADMVTHQRMEWTGSSRATAYSASVGGSEMY